MSSPLTRIRPIEWTGQTLRLLDQRALPLVEEYVECRDVSAVAHAIVEMVVRGAPAIGVTAAYGLVLAARRGVDLAVAREQLVSTRPTAVNLVWAVDRALASLGDDRTNDVAARLEQEAIRIHEEDDACCTALGEAGLELFPADARVLTHCNAGALATAGIGTALGMIRVANAAGRVQRVYADETRPFLQGARLTAWECVTDKIPCTLLADVAAGSLISRGFIDLIVVGTDRTVANGDVANKIGTYPLAVMAHRHGIPFYVAAPTSSIDLSLATGDEIEIEERTPLEVTSLGGRRVAPEGVDIANPAFDVTPAELVTAIITERGIARPPYQESLPRLVHG